MVEGTSNIKCNPVGYFIARITALICLESTLIALLFFPQEFFLSFLALVEDPVDYPTKREDFCVCAN